MPGEVRRYLHITSPIGPALWSTDEATREAVYTRMSNTIYHVPVTKGSSRKVYRLFADLTKRPWVIMPIWVEDEWGSDWVVIVWFSQAIEPVDYFDRIISYGIFDSRRSPDPDDNGRHPPIQERQEAIRHGLHELWRIGGFNADEATIMEVFSSPMPLDEATSGERSFAIVKGLISQSK